MKARPDAIPSLRRRLLVLLLGSALAVLLAGATIDYFTGVAPLRAAYDQALTDAALAVAAHVQVDRQRGLKVNLPPAALTVLKPDSVDSIFFRVLAPDGSLMAGDADLPRPTASPDNPTLEDASYRGRPIRMVTYRNATPAGPVEVCVAETTQKRAQIRTRLLSTVLAVDFVELSVVLALVWLGVQLGLTPLRALRDQIARRSARDLEPLDIGSVPAEVRGLVEVLNRLLVTVRDSSAAQRQFLENAAHQLRTPLAGIQAQLELLATEESAQPFRERLLDVHKATRRLTHTARQLLALARSDQAVNLQLKFERVDLAEVVAANVAENVNRALAAGVDLGVEAQPAITRGIPWLLHELLNNLLENAITHTPPGGSVTVHCGREGEAAFLQVLDTGSGIPVTERARVVERFFRGQHARGDGSGLGLAIVAEVARLHQAQVHIDEGTDGRGTSVRVHFPSDTSF